MINSWNIHFSLSDFLINYKIEQELYMNTNNLTLCLKAYLCLILFFLLLLLLIILYYIILYNVR